MMECITHTCSGDCSRAKRQMILEDICNLESVSLFAALRNAADDLNTRRELTQQVYTWKLTQWKSDSRYAQSMARHLVEDIHCGFRGAFVEVLNQSSKDQINLKQFLRVNSSLHHHHSIEDKWWFPRMMQQFPEIADEIRILEADHQHLVSLEHAIASGDYAALQEFIAALNDHLNREEMLTVPLLMEGDAGL